MSLPPVPGPQISIGGQLTPPWRSWFSQLFSFVTAATIASGVKINRASGVPNGVVTGSPGDLYLNTAGGATTTLYVKESGVNTNTGWVGK